MVTHDAMPYVSCDNYSLLTQCDDVASALGPGRGAVPLLRCTHRTLLCACAWHLLFFRHDVHTV